MEGNKPRLGMLCAQFDPYTLALASQVPMCVIDAIRWGINTTEPTALAILQGINTLQGTRYTIADISDRLEKAR